MHTNRVDQQGQLYFLAYIFFTTTALKLTKEHCNYGNTNMYNKDVKSIHVDPPQANFIAQTSKLVSLCCILELAFHLSNVFNNMHMQ